MPVVIKYGIKVNKKTATKDHDITFSTNTGYLNMNYLVTSFYGTNSYFKVRSVGSGTNIVILRVGDYLS